MELERSRLEKSRAAVDRRDKPVARGKKNPAYLIKEQKKEYEKQSSSRLLVNRAAYRRRDHRHHRRHRDPEPSCFPSRRERRLCPVVAAHDSQLRGYLPGNRWRRQLRRPGRFERPELD